MNKEEDRQTRETICKYVPIYYMVLRDSKSAGDNFVYYMTPVEQILGVNTILAMMTTQSTYGTHVYRK